MSHSFFEKKNIPNFLILFRIILAIFIITFLVLKVTNGEFYHFNFTDAVSRIYVNYFIAGLFFIFASFTDFLDGFIARKKKWVSDFGKIWDPIADKILINGILMALAWEKAVPIFIPIILISRDIIVDGIRIHAIKNNLVLQANIYGKIKTVFQMCGISVLLFIFHFDESNKWQYYLLQNGLIFISTFLSLLSLFVYTHNLYKIVKQA